jgi:hypothetical protein
MSTCPVYPHVILSDTRLRLELFVPQAQIRPVDMPMVIDFDRYSKPIGIELISIRYYGGPNLFNSTEWQTINNRSGLRFTYSDREDVLYVKLEQDRSLDQRTANGRLLLDGSGRLVAIEVDL